MRLPLTVTAVVSDDNLNDAVRLMVMVTVLTMVIMRMMMVMAGEDVVNSGHTAIGTAYANTLRLKEA